MRGPLAHDNFKEDKQSDYSKVFSLNFTLYALVGMKVAGTAAERLSSTRSFKFLN